MKTAGVVILIIILLLLAAAVGWVVFSRWRAQRLGLPPPTLSSFIPFSSSRSTFGVQPAPSGVSGWISDRLRGFKSRNNRTAVGAYEGAPPAAGGRSRNGFGPLDPDDAWDSRVGSEAEAYYYNEEQELGLHPTTYPSAGAGAGTGTNSSRLNVANTAYLGSGSLGGSTYDMNLAGAATDGASSVGFDEDRGRSRGRSPQAAGLGGGGGSGSGGKNPFDDAADPSNLSLRGVSPRPMVEPVTTTAGARDGAKDDSPTERRSMFRENV